MTCFHCFICVFVSIFLPFYYLDKNSEIFFFSFYWICQRSLFCIPYYPSRFRHFTFSSITGIGQLRSGTTIVVPQFSSLTDFIMYSVFNIKQWSLLKLAFYVEGWLSFCRPRKSSKHFQLHFRSPKQIQKFFHIDEY